MKGRQQRPPSKQSLSLCWTLRDLDIQERSQFGLQSLPIDDLFLHGRCICYLKVPTFNKLSYMEQLICLNQLSLGERSAATRASAWPCSRVSFFGHRMVRKEEEAANLAQSETRIATRWAHVILTHDDGRSSDSKAIIYITCLPPVCTYVLPNAVHHQQIHLACVRHCVILTWSVHDYLKVYTVDKST